MKDFYVSDACCHENKVIISSFVVAIKQVKPKKTGDPYLALILADRTGQIEAKMWDNVADCLDGFEQDHFVKVKGLINKYNQRFQLTIHKLRRLAESEIDFTDYLPKTTKDIDGLWRKLSEFVSSFSDPHLKALIRAFMEDEEIAVAYRTAPAAKNLHHAYIGGLLDHVVSLCQSCDLVCRNYPLINRDLLLSGAFLHDIGKIHELTYNRAFAYTTRGQLLGHMVIELEMLHGKLRLFPCFPEELKLLLEHLIISHHGEYEFGSPKLPMFPEALMLHYLDNLDSKMESMRAHFEREAGIENPWTGYNPSLGRPLLNSAKFLSKPVARPEQVSAAAAAAAGESTGTPPDGAADSRERENSLLVLPQGEDSEH
ncbi:MAG: HD domain-containing protein [Acidobacteria bacterium]|nr:HD domain-containing protein [Acidobacteriota bacterium]MBV8891275.1 HD domain-containing protein [Acidobacteriota bacterium]MBV9480536.1 HD domain-containing protein [Acidobacteriota bacterium]